jgi:hypothetical protein
MRQHHRAHIQSRKLTGYQFQANHTFTMPTSTHTLTTTPQTGRAQTNPINYTVQHLKDGTARLLVECKPLSGPPMRPLAVRYSVDHQGETVIRSAALLGFDRINPCLLLLIVRKGDLITIGKKTIGESTATCRHYRVDRGFRLKEIAIEGRGLTHAEIRSLAGACAPMEQAPGCDDSLRGFLADSGHPKWLLPILERQKRKWRANRPSKFYHLVPFEVQESEIPRVVKIAPGAALRFFLPKLKKVQIRSCIRRALATAVVHAFDEITPTQFQRAIRDYPSLLLTHQGTRIPIELLMRCVRFERFDAFIIRKRFPPALHAQILAETCGLPFQLFKCGNISRLPAEIETSFRRYPAVWLEAYDDDFTKLFRTLERSGKMKTCHKLLDFLMSSLPSQHLPALYQYISANI